MIYRVRLWEIQNHDLETKSSRAHQWSSISYIAHNYCVLITIVGARVVSWVRVAWTSSGIERNIIMNLRCRPLFLPSEVVYGRLWGVTRGVVLLLSTSATIPHKMLLIGAQQPMATESSFYEYMVKICYTIPGFDSATPRTWSDHNKMYKKSMSTFQDSMLFDNNISFIGGISRDLHR